MGTSALLGMHAGHNALTATCLHFDGVPGAVVPALRQIWAHTFSRDLDRMLEVLFTGPGWLYLDPDTPTQLDPPRPEDIPVCGVGVRMREDSGPFTLTVDRFLDTVGGWLMVLDPQPLPRVLAYTAELPGPVSLPLDEKASPASV
ncbi:hypothetical protein [Actinocatenispora rupis]|uniref:Uncharacterized protein n=1 Tax=Actinocatenispora rupis TaxID=519421 RepID=A0A8J3JAH5_9ACTN|nr:hypothetical protein [Actinocatenispora rupis]GID14875.1 hypothetical protein Aru02nite_57640 [Actinocatenispora rupis]